MDRIESPVNELVALTLLGRQTRVLEFPDDEAVLLSPREELRGSIEARSAAISRVSGLPSLVSMLKPPARPGVFRRWLWLRRNRSEAADLALFTQEASRAVRARVETDIGVRATSLPLLANIAPGLARETAPVIESAVGGWVGLVEERVGDLPERDRNLATKTLISAVLGSTDARDTMSMVWPGGDLIEHQVGALLGGHVEGFGDPEHGVAVDGPI